MKIKVLVYPYDINPYQNLLYNHMRNGVEIKYLKGSTSSQTINNILLPLLLIKYRVKGYKIFHLHWTYGFTFPGKNYLSLFFSTIYYYLILTFIKFTGYKIVWTVHNILPHEKQFINDIYASKVLSKLCNVKIVHSKSAIDEMRHLDFDIKNINIIPHGNYIESYVNEITRKEARRILNINNNDFIFLFFGRVEKYKGIEYMLNEFSKINNHNIKLIICGACTDPELLTKIQLYITNSNITFINKHINNNDIQIFMNASDTVILPFNKINSSGSAILALSFAKTIIAPQKGTLNEMPKNVGYFYSNGNNNGLYKSMINSISKRNMLEIIGQNGYEYIKTFSWNNISKKTLRLYKELEQKD